MADMGGWVAADDRMPLQRRNAGSRQPAVASETLTIYGDGRKRA